MSIGPAEIIIVLVIALLVFGPSRLPQMGRSLGRGVREFKKAADTAKNELGLGEVTDQINEVKAAFTEPLKGVTDTFGDLKASVDVKSAIEAPVQAAGAAGAATAVAGAATQAATPGRPGKPLGVVEEGPETPAVTPATVFADVTPPVSPEVPEAQPPVETPEAPPVEAAAEAAPDGAAVVTTAVAEPAAPSGS